MGSKAGVRPAGITAKNVWKDIGNVIFPNGFINFPKFWLDCLSTTFQLLEGQNFITFPNWKWMEMHYWKYIER